jgi:hypothetical protein
VPVHALSCVHVHSEAVHVHVHETCGRECARERERRKTNAQGEQNEIRQPGRWRSQGRRRGMTGKRRFRYADAKRGLPRIELQAWTLDPMGEMAPSLDRGRESGVSAPPPSEPCMRISRTRLSSWWFYLSED